MEIGGLAAIVGTEHVLTGAATRGLLGDMTESRGVAGHAEAVVRPADAGEVAAVMAWCWEHGVALTPRGGGTGYAGGCVPQGGVVVALERLRDVRSFEPLLWRAEVEAGLTTHDVRRRARESGLYYPPDPGAGEQSHIGGNVATNAGGPHAFKYGVTGAWVTGLEVVLPPGRLVRIGGAVRKDVAGYDLRSLLIGSEGTLGIVTAVTLRFVPAPEAALPAIAFYADEHSGGEAVQAAMASGIVPAALEFLDREALEIVRAAFPFDVPPDAGFALIAEADGDLASAQRGQAALHELMAPDALAVHLPSAPAEVAALWRWREGVGLAAAAALGGKASEDVGVPVERLAEIVAGTRAIGARHDLATCSFGHAGDGNVHATFLLRSGDATATERAHAAAQELFALAIELGGTVSGEHGLGGVKNGQLRHQWDPAAVALHDGVKRLFDPRGLLNPGKKLA
jgi:glycolate oxidase subunit GlcD